MNDAQLTDLVRTYFSAVDREDLDGVLATLTPDCRFSVETHGVVLNGHAEISGMFRRLWSSHAAVLHNDFAFVPNAATGRISTQFQVTNTEVDGSKTNKSNCNFFTLKDDRFSSVAVYMAGANTLDSDSAAKPAA